MEPEISLFQPLIDETDESKEDDALDPQIHSLLDTFEAAWMGKPKPVSALPPPSVLRDETLTAGPSLPGNQHLHNGASKNSINSSLSSTPSTHGVSVPISSKRAHEESRNESEPSPLPMTPFQSNMLIKGNSAAAAAVAVPTPSSVHGMKAATEQQQQQANFAPVFFSPIPLSYLHLARSESTESFLGSPETTQRGSRLASAAIAGDWPAEDGASSPSNSLSGNHTGLLSSSLQDAAHRNGRSRLGTSDAGPSSLNSISEHPILVTTSSASPSRSPESEISGGAIIIPVHKTTVDPSPFSRPSTSRHNASSPNLTHPFLSRPPVAPAVVPSKATAHTPLGIPFASGMDPVAPLGSIAAAASLSRSRKWSALKLVAGTAMIPHIDKVEKGGEDAACISLKALGAIGVADGVSGWADEGIDPAEYSRTLIRFASEALESSEHPHGADPREVIRHAHVSTVMAGSSTICVAVMKPHGKMHVANLGDSGVRVIREGQVVFASEAQQHVFNMPYQLSHPSIIESPDNADCADVSLVDVQPGDIIVMATDGLYDNVFDEEIARICVEALKARRTAALLALAGGDAPPSPQSFHKAASLRREAENAPLTTADAEHVAMSIARVAHAYALNPHQKTPWSVSACETGMPWARFFLKGGGKMDDVTVIVGFVVEEGRH
ncbi:hypothetical protein CEUSTIGMA_g12550.t1 [Chlamydomonas eustigma]|uniref:Protein phosphatase n=1 Tax=Chlamydomonas eustigma TaxID=1157962 RepID=A0A250XQP8_9CHLO|nr:hypothetical protein CEUSTIGMA_g12550.t1 [Chlamydomonas eustigma]|eukprot:GAX85130.1 hypothetical protein CEUSTIGMA_g12550.t1 [Chlamydomonas eustigma]